MDLVPHEQQCQPLAAGVSSADSEQRPGLFHTPLMKAFVQPTKYKYLKMYTIIIHVLIYIFFSGSEYFA